MYETGREMGPALAKREVRRIVMIQDGTKTEKGMGRRIEKAFPVAASCPVLERPRIMSGGAELLARQNAAAKFIGY